MSADTKGGKGADARARRWLDRVTADGTALHAVPHEARSTEVCLAAVRQCGAAVVFLTKEHRSPEVLLAAVEQDGLAIVRMSGEERSQAVCLAAVRQNYWAFTYLTGAERSQEVLVAAAGRCAFALRDMTSAERTFDVCLAAVRKDGFILHDLKDHERELAVCLAAVRQAWHSVQFLTCSQRSALENAVSAAGAQGEQSPAMAAHQRHVDLRDTARVQMAEAAALGAKAYGDGIQAAPALDKRVCAMLEGRRVGQTPPGEAPTAALLDAWQRGFQEALDRAMEAEGTPQAAEGVHARSWIVLFRTSASEPPHDPEGFLCVADDEIHAAEQLLDAEPEAKVVHTVQTTNMQSALESYYAGPWLAEGQSEREDPACAQDAASNPVMGPKP